MTVKELLTNNTEEKCDIDFVSMEFTNLLNLGHCFVLCQDVEYIEALEAKIDEINEEYCDEKITKQEYNYKMTNLLLSDETATVCMTMEEFNVNDINFLVQRLLKGHIVLSDVVFRAAGLCEDDEEDGDE